MPDLNVQGLRALDLRTTKPDGEPWKFLLRAGRHPAYMIAEMDDPDWITGAPPCTDVCRLNVNLNFGKINQTDVHRRLQEAMVRLRCVVRLYRRQIRRGKFSCMNIHVHLSLLEL